MRILFVSHTFPLEGEPLSNVGGMQRLAVEQEIALASHPDVELTSLVLRSSSRWTELRTGPFLLRLLWEIPRIVRSAAVDVVLFSSMVTAALAPLLKPRLRGTRVKLAATPVGRDVTLPNPAYQRLVPRIFSALDLVLPISRATAEECLSRGLAPEKLRIVPCGVDPSRFPPVENRSATRAELLAALKLVGGAPIPEGALLLCSVGRHQERKGFHWFVEHVMPRLPEDVVYLLGGSGPMTPRIQEIVRHRNLRDRVRVLGRISEEMLLTLFRGADLFVMPNIPVPGDMEGFGVVMLEAGLCGLPILAADLEGIRDVVRDGENGMLLPAGDADAFARAIESFRHNPGRLEAASRSSVQATLSRFSWEVVVEQYLEALRPLNSTTGALAPG
ncbi:MAG TPA: glycosyltransferase family 4 protein [Longimicrobiaceae bacterium]